MASPKNSCWWSARIRWPRQARSSCVTAGSESTTSICSIVRAAVSGTAAADSRHGGGWNRCGGRRRHRPRLAGVPVVHFGHLCGACGPVLDLEDSDRAGCHGQGGACRLWTTVHRIRVVGGAHAERPVLSPWLLDWPVGRSDEFLELAGCQPTRAAG